MDEVEGVKMGTQDITILGAIDRFAPNFTMFNLPFMYRDKDHCYNVLTGPLGKKYILDDLVKRHGNLRAWLFLFRRTYADDRRETPRNQAGGCKRIKIAHP